MTLTALKQQLAGMNELKFTLPDGSLIPAHAHITEVGSVHKRYIDCGGTIREEYKVSAQLWVSVDTDHRLLPEKLLRIIQLAEEKAGVTDGEVDIEYQGRTIERYGLETGTNGFQLTVNQTACLAQDQCGIPVQKEKRSLADLKKESSCCTPGGGCC